MKNVFLISLFFFISIAAFSQSGNDNQVWSRVEALTKAIFEKKDSAALLDLVSSNVTYGHSTGNIEDKATMVQKAMGSKQTYKNLEFEKGSIDIDGNTAVLRHNLRGITMENGAESPLNLAILQVWRKENGKWRIWARQAVKIPPKS
jgi:hypothetical protein